MAATLWEQNGQRSCAVSVPRESVSVAPETHCAVAEPAGFTERCDRSETGAVWLQSSQIVASTTGAATTIAKSNIMRNALNCIVKHLTGIFFIRQGENKPVTSSLFDLWRSRALLAVLTPFSPGNGCGSAPLLCPQSEPEFQTREFRAICFTRGSAPASDIPPSLLRQGRTPGNSF